MFHLILDVLLTILISIALLTALVTIYYYYAYFWAKYYLYKLPQLPQYPIVGSVLLYPNNCAIYNNCRNFGKKYGRTYLAMMSIEPVVFTTDAKLLEILLSSTKHINKSRIYKVVRGALGNGLVSGNGDIWRKQRKLLTPTFHFKILEQFIPIFNRHTNELVKKLDIETVIVETDILPHAKQWSLGEVIETVMGLKPEGNHLTLLYGEAGRQLLQITMERLVRPNEFIDFTYFFSSNYWKEQRVLKTMKDHIKAVIKRKEKEYDDGLLEKSNSVNEVGSKQKTVSLDLLIEYQKNGEQITYTDMEDQVQTIMYAAYDTTATTVALALYNFANNPHVQEKVFQEAYEVLGDDINQDITSTHLHEMKYLHMALKESLRVTSSIPAIARELHEDLEWEGITYPKGLTIIAPISGVHMDPEYFPEPEKFIPERFTPENINKRPPYAYIPFSAGPRNCIGQKYAILASKVCLTKLLLNYEFSPVDHQLSLAAEIVLTPKTGVKLCVRRRQLPKTNP